ncbi:MAG TPA: glycosyltransferase [Acidimicrobiales bacterium]|nr:glycosyltransferase [Acidimicrobiales bacterium]
MTAQPPEFPEVSVVMPARDAAATIAFQLAALADQSFDRAWELIVVDDGSRDETAEVAARWADRFPSFKILATAEPRGQSHALNIGTRAARGRLIAYCDADDVVSTRWLAGLTSALSEASMVTGPFDLAMLNPPRLYSWRPSPMWQRLPRWRGYLAPVINANMGVRAETFENLGGFDEELTTCEDYDFSFRVQLAGGTIGFARDAVLHYRLRRGWPYFRRLYEYGLGHVELYHRFRNQGLRRGIVRGTARLVAAGLGAPVVVIRKYRYGWITLAGVELGRLRGSLRKRTLFL